MKISYSLVTLAISTLASAYCVSPAIQPTFTEEQNVIVKSATIPGTNQLQYCSTVDDSPTILLEANFDPMIPIPGKRLQISLRGISFVPVAPGAQFRILNAQTRQELLKPTDFFTYLKSAGVNQPSYYRDFRLNFVVTIGTLQAPVKEIIFELIYPGYPKLLCVKTPIQDQGQQLCNY